MYVYVIESESGLIKIGITGNMRNRLAQIRCQCGFENLRVWRSGRLVREVAERIENGIFLSLASSRRYGEWFNVKYERAVNTAESFCGGFEGCMGRTATVPSSLKRIRLVGGGEGKGDLPRQWRRKG